ncbi:MAG: hypothetical protein ACRDKY_00735 [Solirubrobacteraceae bacterium]
MHDPRAEANARLGGAYDARVLEPSPPAVAGPPWFADDPVDPGPGRLGRRVVSPVATGDVLWDELAAGDPGLAAWCADRWLGAYMRLAPVPPSYTVTRLALHLLAERTISPERERANGKIGLRYTRGGFGTPFFGDGRQVRVEGAELVAVGGAGERRERLDVEPVAVHALAEVFGFATNVLETLRAELPEAARAGRVQLWPEHFDVGLDLRSPSGEALVAGMSPGDADHDRPYVYVVGTKLAELQYASLLAAEDQRTAALEFLRAAIIG